MDGQTDRQCWAEGWIGMDGVEGMGGNRRGWYGIGAYLGKGDGRVEMIGSRTRDLRLVMGPSLAESLFGRTVSET